MTSLKSLKILFVVRTIIENPSQEVLLLRRKNNRSYNPGLWEIPGGKVLENETIEDAIERVIVRESNLIIKKTSDRCYLHSRVVIEEGKYEGFTYIEAAVCAMYLAGNVKIDEGDHNKSVWVPISEALEFDLSIESRKILSQYISSEVDRKVREQPEVTIVSRALVENDDGNFLLIKRPPKGKYPNLWEVPGGCLSSFESLEEHLVREVLEETGLVISLVKPNLYIHTYIPKTGTKKGGTFLNIINFAKIKAGKLKLSDEHVDSKWVSADEIMDYDLADYMILPLTEVIKSL